MALLRKCNTPTIILCLGMVLILGYSYMSLQESYQHVRQKEHEIVKRRTHENILSEHLKVVYHHTTRIEEELTKERERHKTTQSELLEKKKEFYMNLTKTKHEAWTRFNALDSNYKMLKAEHEEMKTNYLGLQSQYRRLSSDHRKISKEAKESYEVLKNSRDSESFSLQDRIQDLYKKNTYYRQLADQNEDYYMKIQGHLKTCTKLSIDYKNRLSEYFIKLKRIRDEQQSHKNIESANVIKKQTEYELDGKLAELQKHQQNMTDQKNIDKSQLKNITGVNNLSLDKDESKGISTTLYKNDPNGDKKDDNSETRDETKKNEDVQKMKDNSKDFMQEQKNRFLHRSQNAIETNSKLAQNDHYGVSKTTTRYNLAHENGRYKNSAPQIEEEPEREIRKTTGTMLDRLHQFMDKKKEEEKSNKLKDEIVENTQFRGSDEQDINNINNEVETSPKEVVQHKLKTPVAANEPVEISQLNPPGGVIEERDIVERPLVKQSTITESKIKLENNIEPDNLKRNNIEPDNQKGNNIEPDNQKGNNIETDNQKRNNIEPDNIKRNKNIPLVRPIKRQVENKLTASDKIRDERMDVKKVTLEDDENGDQNLDDKNNAEDEQGEAGNNEFDDKGESKDNQYSEEEGLQEQHMEA